jgi:hypothetical protein
MQFSCCCSRLIRHTISQSYDRKMRAKYQQDLMGFVVLLRRMLVGRLQQSHVEQWLREHGHSDTFVVS